MDLLWTYLVLILDSIAESIFFPLPPDFLLIPACIENPENWFIYAALVTAFSIIGGMAGYWIGSYFRKPVEKFIGAEKVKKVEGLYKKYGAYAVFIAGFSPIPYKIFTLSSGILRYNFIEFVVLSLISRGLRFFTVAYVSAFYGEEAIKLFVDNPLVILAVAIAGVALIFLAKWAWKKIKAKH